MPSSHVLTEMLPPRRSVLALACLASLLHPQVAVADSTLRTVALSGSQAPGTPDGVRFANFRRHNLGSQLLTPVMNNHGRVAFTGTIRGPAINDGNDVAIFSEGDGAGLAPVQREDGLVPDVTSNTYFSSLSALPYINDNGDVYYTARFRSAGSVQLGSFRHREGESLRIDIREELFPLALPGQYHELLANPRLSDNGSAALTASLLESGVRIDHAIFRELPGGGFERVAEFDQAAPGLPPFVTFGSLEQELGVPNRVFSMRGLLDSGQSQIAFAAKLKGAGVTDRNDLALYRSNAENNQLTLIVRSGDPAPFTPPGVTLHPDIRVVANLEGGSVFTAVQRDSSNTIINAGIFADDGKGELRPVALTDGLAPGVEGDFVFRRFEIPQIDAQGDTAFAATLVNSNDVKYGIFREHDKLLQPVAVEGQPAPGTDDGVVIGSLSGLINGYSMNAAGQVAFNTRLAGPNIGSENDSALYATDAAGVLQLIVREGGLLDVSNDPSMHDIRIVRRFNFSAETAIFTGVQNGFNDRGQVVFSAEFTDGSGGVFVSNLVAAVPEPSSAVLLLLSLCGVERRSCWVRKSDLPPQIRDM